MSLPIDLPAISIPEIPLPIEIPELIHPAVVHFAIAIPVVIFLLEIYNLAAKRRTISAFSLFLLIVVAVAMFGAYLTGGVDGKATWDILSTEAQGDLKAHKLLGTYLVYASAALVIFKLLFMAIRKTLGRLIFILMIGGFIAATLYQGKEGGELVYKYGANNEMVTEMKDSASDATEEQEELTEKFEALQTKYDELEAKSKEAAAKPEADKAEEKAPKADTKEEAEKEESAKTEEKAPEADAKEEAEKEESAKTEESAEEDKADEKSEEADKNETAPSTETNSSH